MADKYDWIQVAKEVVATVDAPTLATASVDGTPRAVTVGAELRHGILNWRSLPGRYHSKQIEENPQVAFDFFDPVTRRAVYGVAVVASVDPDDEGFLRYQAKAHELWVVIDEKVDGEYIEPQQLNPEDV